MTRPPERVPYRLETGTVRAVGGGFFGTFKIFAVEGPSIDLLYLDDGSSSAVLPTGIAALDDAYWRAQRWIDDGGLTHHLPKS